jgi:hypothetical protein
LVTRSPAATDTSVTVPEAPNASDVVRTLVRLPVPVTVAVTVPRWTVVVRAVEAVDVPGSPITR